MFDIFETYLFITFISQTGPTLWTVKLQLYRCLLIKIRPVILHNNSLSEDGLKSVYARHAARNYDRGEISYSAGECSELNIVDIKQDKEWRSGHKIEMNASYL